VLAARHPDQALAAAERHAGPLDLLLTDVVMPRMRRARPGRAPAAPVPGLKVLYMSGYADEAIVHHGCLDPGRPSCRSPHAGRPDA